MIKGVHQSIEFLNYGNSPLLLVWYRTEDNPLLRQQIVVENFTPRFYVEGDQRHVKSKYIRKSYLSKKITQSLWHSKVTKVETWISSDVKLLRQNEFDGIQTYQGNILLPRVLLIETGVRGGFWCNNVLNDKVDWKKFHPATGIQIPARIHYGDIEVDNRGDVDPDPNDPEQAIVMISWIDNYDHLHPRSVVWHPKWANLKKPKLVKKKYIYEYSKEEAEWNIYCFPDEISMLKYFIKRVGNVEDPDVMTGWWYTAFDMPYIINRCRTLNQGRVDGRLDIRKLSPLCRAADKLGISSSNAKVVAKVQADRPEIYLPGREVIDLLEAYKKYASSEGKKESYNLDFIGNLDLKLQKLHFEGNVGQLWFDDVLNCLRYNLRDAEICYFVDKVRGILKMYDLYRREVGCLWRDVLYPATVLGTDQIRAANAKGICLPTSYAVKKEDKKKKKFKGAYVIMPIFGIHRNVFAFDLKSLYLRLIDQWNISPDVYVDPAVAALDYSSCIQTPNGLFWKRDEDGFARESVRYYQEKRNEFRNLAAKVQDEKGEDDPMFKVYDDQQKAYKQFSLVFWGVFGHEGSELFWKPMAEAVTSSGQEVLLFTKERLESDDLKQEIFNFCGLDVKIVVVYGDTDSNYAEVHFDDEDANNDKDFLTKVADRISEWLNKEYQKVADKWNCPKNCMSIRCEKIYEVYFMTLTEDMEPGKKCYAGKTCRVLVQEKGQEHWVPSNKTEFKGFEKKRSDNSPIGREIQGELLDLILDDFDPKRSQDFNRLHKFLTRKRKEYFTAQRPITDYAIPKSISKQIGQYGRINKKGQKGSIPAHVRAANYSNLRLKMKFGKGAKIYYVYVKELPPRFPRTDVIAFQYAHQIPAGTVIDYQIMWEKQIQKKVERVLRGLNLKYNEVLSGKRQVGILEWGKKGASVV